jgi:hypothetical protein
MIKVLWIINKYVVFDKYEENYQIFLDTLQDILLKYNIELHYIYFNKKLYKRLNKENNHYFNNLGLINLSDIEINKIGLELEKKYKFTFKQSCFADIIQNVNTHKNQRNIDIPYKNFINFRKEIENFLNLENLILTKNINVIFSDQSPESEMEFGRIIGNYFNKIVIKDYEGPFLGRSVFIKSNDFGSDEVINCDLNSGITSEESHSFIKNYIKYKKLPYTYPPSTTDNKKINYPSFLINKLFSKNVLKDIYRFFMKFYFLIEEKLFKKLIYDTFNKDLKYFFFGFHLNQESTMVLRAQPYTNQVTLLEMLSRVLPLNHYIYVREHPHWKSTFSLSYLKNVKKFSNIKLISPDISIHDILKNSKGVITYNSTTGIESLFYEKPVLSFASNIYYRNHSSVFYCDNLYLLGENLINVLNTKVDKEETINFFKKMYKCSYNFGIGSHYFISNEDAIKKAKLFSMYFSTAIKACHND